MRVPPYIRSHELREGMSERPRRPFFVSPGDYTVVDGDTFSINIPDPSGKGKLQAFRIRIDSIDTPEMPKIGANDKLMRSIGIDPHAGSPGRIATKLLRELSKGRALLVEPVVQEDGGVTDKYTRLIANVSLSGRPGKQFSLIGATSVAVSLYDAGLAYIMEDKTLPPKMPDLVRSLLDANEQGVNALSPEF